MKEKRNKGLNNVVTVALIVGIVVGVVVLISIITIIVLVVVKERNKRIRKQKKDNPVVNILFHAPTADTIDTEKNSD
jgi:hypothetical protein